MEERKKNRSGHYWPLTIDELRAVLAYDKESGVLTRLYASARKDTLGPVKLFRRRGNYLVNVLGGSLPPHRIAWALVTGTWPKEIDHIDGCKANNKWENLRLATKATRTGRRGRKKERSQNWPPTVDEMRSKFSYDKETGLITRLKSRSASFLGVINPTPNSAGYQCINVFGRSLQAHRIAWVLVTGQWPDKDIDHKDGNRLNNKWNNLRLATHSQNMQNTKLRKQTKTGYKGVCKVDNGYIARIRVNKQPKYLGYFPTPQEASLAYEQAALQEFGEFANVVRPE